MFRVESMTATCCFGGSVPSILEWEDERVEMLNNARCAMDGMHALTNRCVDSIEECVEVNNVEVPAPYAACLSVVPEEKAGFGHCFEGGFNGCADGWQVPNQGSKRDVGSGTVTIAVTAMVWRIAIRE